jgi:hypothetical protein
MRDRRESVLIVMLGVALFLFSVVLFFFGGRFVIPILGQRASDIFINLLWIASFGLVGFGTFRLRRPARSN